MCQLDIFPFEFRTVERCLVSILIKISFPFMDSKVQVGKKIFHIGKIGQGIAILSPGPGVDGEV